jgi:hypothetical protein
LIRFPSADPGIAQLQCSEIPSWQAWLVTALRYGCRWLTSRSV